MVCFLPFFLRKLIRIKDKLSNMETEIDINQNADENLDAALTVSSPR